MAREIATFVVVRINVICEEFAIVQVDGKL